MFLYQDKYIDMLLYVLLVLYSILKLLYVRIHFTNNRESTVRASRCMFFYVSYRVGPTVSFQICIYHTLQLLSYIIQINFVYKIVRKLC